MQSQPGAGSRVPLQGLFKSKGAEDRKGGSRASTMLGGSGSGGAAAGTGAGRGSNGKGGFLNMFLKPSAPQTAAQRAGTASREEEAFEKMRAQFAKIRERQEQQRRERAHNVQTFRARSRFARPVDQPQGQQSSIVRNNFSNFQRLKTRSSRRRMTKEERLRLPLLPREVVIDDEMTVKDLAHRMGLNIQRMTEHLEDLDEPSKPDSPMAPELAELLVTEFGQTPVRDDLRFPYVANGPLGSDIVFLSPGFNSLRTRTDLPADEEELAALPLRSPVVTVMGHVDHGKTTLLDCLRSAHVTLSEAGGITQNVAAFTVPVDTVPVTMKDLEQEAQKGGAAKGTAAKKKGGKKAKKTKKKKKAKKGAKGQEGLLAPKEWVTFLDTPGHALFSRMRSAGTAVTDISVLVVAATDGVMPQTAECVSLILDAKVPVVVAITKADMLSEIELESAVQRINQQLLEHSLVTEEFGGEAQTVTLSAKTGDGMTELLEAIQLQAEVLELKAPIKADGEAVVLEATKATGMGPVVDVLVRWGTLKLNDWVVCGNFCGKIRALMSDGGKRLKQAGPSMPVRVSGLKELPAAGADLLVVANESVAEKVVEGRTWRLEREAQKVTEARVAAEAAEEKRKRIKTKKRIGLERYIERLERRRQAKLLNGEELPPELENIPTVPDHLLETDEEEDSGPVEVPAILKAAVHGSVAAITDALAEYPTDEVAMKIVQSGIGDVTESEVDLAATIGASIFAFDVRVPPAVQKAADQKKVKVVTADIIYRLMEDIEDVLSRHLAPDQHPEVTGVAEVKQVFGISSGSSEAAGCLVTSGEITRKSRYRVLRDDEVVAEASRLSSLKHFKDDVRSVKKGSECGLVLAGGFDFQPGDRVEAFHIKSTPRRIKSMARSR